MKTTKKQFDLFTSYCDKWINVYGLINWDIRFELGETEGMIATSEWFYSNKLAIITLSTDHEMDFAEHELNRIALHEVSHVLLAGYQHLMENNLTKDEFRDPIDHDVIRCLENVLIGKGYNGNKPKEKIQ